MSARTEIRVKPARNREPVAPRTCCQTHADNCRFGRSHVWSGPFLLNHGFPVDGKIWSHDDDVKCFECNGVCTAESEGRA